MNDSLSRYRPYFAMILLFAVVLAGTVLVLRRPEPSPMLILTPTPRPTPTVALIVVDVRGAVARPGVYKFPAGSRLQDALAQAGDLLPNADTSGLNPARKLIDGEQITVYLVGQAPPTSAPTAGGRTAAATKTPPGLVHLNSATVDELDALPGVGPTIAQRIVDYRDQNGSFEQIEDLKRVHGIGDALFAQIKDLITLQ